MRGVDLNATASYNTGCQMKQGANTTLGERCAYVWRNQHQAHALKSRLARNRALDNTVIFKVVFIL